ncbi:hypothetical protein GYA28_02300 [Candidatus Roizmanbacteria bacterium]|jgi:foldase protein PrsA|nr:hypothetical protein [Candidatus Roizmanbacteria bacterium]
MWYTEPMSKKSTVKTPKKTNETTKKFKVSKKIILVSLIVLALLALVCFLRFAFIAAIVNGKPISRLKVVKELERQGGKTTLDTIITQELILQEANKRKITFSQKDIDAEIKKIEKSIVAQGLTLDQVLQQEGMKKTDLAAELKIQLIVQKIVGNNANVTDKEVEDYISSQKEQLSASGTEELSADQVKQQLKQQKLQQKIQDFVAELRNKAKINYFVSY